VLAVGETESDDDALLGLKEEEIIRIAERNGLFQVKSGFPAGFVAFVLLAPLPAPIRFATFAKLFFTDGILGLAGNLARTVRVKAITPTERTTAPTQRPTAVMAIGKVAGPPVKIE